MLTACGTSSGDAGADPTATSPSPSASDSPTPSATATTAPAGTTTQTPEPPDTTSAPTPSATATPSEAAKPAASAKRSPVGRWRNRELAWVLRIKASGRFVEDFDGVKNIRSGTWRLKGKVVVLKGGDGITTRGRLAGDTITIRGTVLKRVR